MASRNDITGDLIKTKANSDTEAYADGWERIFGKKDKPETHKILRQDTKWEGPPIDLASSQTATDKPVVSALCDICGKELNKVGECAWTSCPLNWNESRADIIGQNGNVGYESEK